MASPLYDSIEIRETVDGEAVTGTGLPTGAPPLPQRP